MEPKLVEYYCCRSSTNYELLDYFLHDLNLYYIMIPCTFVYNGKKYRGHVYEDDYRVFVSSRKKDGPHHLECTMRRNKYTGIVEGMRRLQIKFSIPIEYKSTYDKLKEEIKEKNAIRKRYRKIIGDDVVYDWLIDRFYKANRTAEELKTIWEDLQSFRKSYPNVPFSWIIRKYDKEGYDIKNHAKVLDYCERNKL